MNLFCHHIMMQPENILIDKSLSIVKLADFGSSRSSDTTPPFTDYTSTRWYRAPECILSNGFYGQAMDVWAAGCVLFEMFDLYPLFPGIHDMDQIDHIHRVLGSPTDQVLAKLIKNIGSRSSSHVTLQKQVGMGFTHLLAGTSPECLDLLKMMLVYDPSERITAMQSLNHPYLQDLENHEVQTVMNSDDQVMDNHADVRDDVDLPRNELDFCIL
jgi:renal tumor antigen